MLHELLNALEETLFMVFTAGVLTWLIGLPLGALLCLTKPDHLIPSPLFNHVLALILNTARSIPFVIFLIALIPFTRLLMGTGEGSIAAILPITLAGIPLFAQLTFNALQTIPKGVIEAAETVGATSFQILYKVLIPEALPDIIKALAETLIQILGYSVMAGVLGAGGIGGLVVQKGYQTFQMDYILTSAILLILLVQIIKICSNYIVEGSLKRQS